MRRLKEILDLNLNHLGLQQRVKENLALQAWPEVAGQKLARFTRAGYVSDGVIFVTVDSPAWAHQLSFLKGEFLKKYRQALGSDAIKDIRFQIGTAGKNIRPPGKGETGENAEYCTEWDKINIDHASLARINAAAAGLADDFRAIFIRAAQRDWQDKEQKKARGWKTCPDCQTVHNFAGERCHFCSAAAEESRTDSVRKLLYDLPSLSFTDTRELIPGLSLDEYNQVKNGIIRQLEDLIRRAVGQQQSAVAKKELQQAIRTVVMLKTVIEPAAINAETIISAVGYDTYLLLEQSN